MKNESTILQSVRALINGMHEKDVKVVEYIAYERTRDLHQSYYQRNLANTNVHAIQWDGTSGDAKRILQFVDTHRPNGNYQIILKNNLTKGEAVLLLEPQDEHNVKDNFFYFEFEAKPSDYIVISIQDFYYSMYRSTEKNLITRRRLEVYSKERYEEYLTEIQKAKDENKLPEDV